MGFSSISVFMAPCIAEKKIGFRTGPRRLQMAVSTRCHLLVQPDSACTCPLDSPAGGWSFSIFSEALVAPGLLSDELSLVFGIENAYPFISILTNSSPRRFEMWYILM